MLDLAGTDAHGDRAERAVRGRVTVAAHDGHARLGESELRPDDVDDALFGVAHRVQADSELLAIAPERLHLGARDGVGDRLVDVDGGDVVVLGGDRQVGSAHGATGQPQPIEGLRAGDLVDEVQIDVDEIGFARGALAGAGGHDVVGPNLLGHGAGCVGHDVLPSASRRCRAGNLTMRDASIYL